MIAIYKAKKLINLINNSWMFLEDDDVTKIALIINSAIDKEIENVKNEKDDN